MSFGTVILKPSLTRLPNYTGCNLENKKLVFSCSSCGTSVNHIFDNSEFSKTETSQLVKIFNIPLVGKSHDGGWPNFQKSECQNCSKKYAVYIGVNETSNSVYTLTLQGAVEIEN